MTLQPREAASLIARLAKDVKICEHGVKKVADMMKKEFVENKYDIKKWKMHELHPKTMDDSSIKWIFFINTLNFSFWTEELEQHEIEYNGNRYTGYWSLCAGVNRALKEGYPILSAEFLATVPLKTLNHIFRSETNTEMPLMQERVMILNETGYRLGKKFGGSFKNVIALCENSAQKLIQLVVENFPQYRDEAVIEGHRVAFYKRAQILVSDIWACFEGQGYGNFYDIDTLTIFADYRVPQVLAYFGVLKYSQELMEKLKTGYLENRERLEVEIRGCAVEAVEMICKIVKNQLLEEKIDIQFNAVLADYYLWDYRRCHADEVECVPFHKTRCIYY